MNDEKAVAVPIARDERGVVLNTHQEAWDFAGAIVVGSIAPKGMTQADIFSVVQAGAEFGLPPMSALTNFKVINGRAGPMVKCAKAKVMQSGLIEGMIDHEYVGKEFEDDYLCRVTSKRKGHPKAVVTTFSVADAKRAGLWNKAGPWSSYPKRMCYYRALGFHLDELYPDVMVGFVIAEALEDYPDPSEKEVAGVTLTKVEPRGNDPILDLLPSGAKAEDLEQHLEEQESFGDPEGQPPGPDHVPVCGTSTCYQPADHEGECDEVVFTAARQRVTNEQLVGMSAECDGPMASDIADQTFKLQTREVQDPFEDSATVTVPEEDPIDVNDYDKDGDRMSDKQQIAILKRLEDADNAPPEADPSNSAPEGEEQGNLEL